MAVTLKDVALEVGLSVPTVSEALRNDPASRLAPETRQRIAKAAKELGYSHNRYARALSTGKSHVIGLLMESLTLEVDLAKLQAVYRMIGGRGYSAEMRNTTEIEENQARFLREFAGRMAEGVIAVQGLWAASHDSVLSLMSQGTPVVSMEPALGLDIDWVIFDRAYGGYIATSHLLETGREKIALLHGQPPPAPLRGRFHGYLQALEEVGIAADEKLMARCEGPGAPKNGFDAMKVLLSRKADFNAVFCYNDNVALGAMRAMMDEGLRIPEDVAVVGFDNSTLSPYVHVPLTTVEQPVEEVARLATNLLFERMKAADTAAPKKTIAVKPSLVVRQSSRAV